MTFSLTNSPPSGAAINSATGAFTWTPTESQTTTTFDVTVSDGTATDSETITVTVNKINTPPVLAPISDKTISLDTRLAFPLTATDADGDHLTYRSSGFIYHGEVITRDGMFLWTPTDVGQYDFAITVSDGIASDTETFRITVNNLVTIPNVPEPIIQIVSELNNNKCLSISGANTNNGANVIMWECHDGANQKWSVSESGYITSELNNNKCLSISGANTNNGADIVMWDCVDAINQKWNVTDSGHIVSELNNKCLDISGANPNNGANVIMWECHDGANQKWKTADSG